jgi:glycosyltransferase involved in cell wall biosynthesis
MGIGSHIWNLSKELAQMGFQIVVVERGTLQGTSKEIHDHLSVYRVPFLPLYPIHAHLHSFFLKKFLKKLSFDILHSHSPLVPPISVQGCPLITTFHTPMRKDVRESLRETSLTMHGIMMKMQAPISYSLEYQLIDLSDQILAVSKNVAAELREYGLKKTEIVSNGVDPEMFSCRKFVETDPPTISYVGRLALRKGLFDLLKAAAVLKKENYDFRLLIAGKGPIKNKLIKISRKLQLTDHVYFIGHFAERQLILLYQRSSFVVIPSHYESGPLVALEGMACGRPIIATPVGIIPELINDGKNGLLTSIRDHLSLADKMRLLLERPDLQASIGKAARETILKGWTWKIKAEKLRRIYERFL